MEEVSNFSFKVFKLYCIIYVYNIAYVIMYIVLAAWFRLKYPHVALGALASSAPVLYFDNITPHNGYYSIATKDFRVRS